VEADRRAGATQPRTRWVVDRAATAAEASAAPPVVPILVRPRDPFGGLFNWNDDG
jgi:hypothetical protein